MRRFWRSACGMAAVAAVLASGMAGTARGQVAGRRSGADLRADRKGAAAAAAAQAAGGGSGGGAASTGVPRLGAIPHGEGAGKAVMFRVWAPDAREVGVLVGGRGSHPKPMAPDPKLPGHWFLDGRTARAGDEYLFVIDGHAKRDPQARQVAGDQGVVVDAKAYRWPASEAAWRTPKLEDMVMYELHLGTFAGGLPGNGGALARAQKGLPYLAKLGINAIQLMPVNEFMGDRSWGYNPSDVYAIERAYGTPDEFRDFVAAAHAEGMAVTVDIVHNHWGPDDLATWKFMGGWGEDEGGIYFYEDEARAHTEWGPRPNFGRAEVRQFVQGSVRMFLEEYHVDGFRWDSVWNIRYTPGHGAEPNPEGEQMLREINGWMAEAFPRAVRVAEDHAYDGAGVGFQGQWNSAYQSMLSEFLSKDDRSKDVRAFAGVLQGLKRGWVQFAECHDSAGDLNNHHRLPRMIDPGNPESARAKGLSLLGNALAMTMPGTPMMLQGMEMHETADFAAETDLPWQKARGARRGLVAATADLIGLRRNREGYTAGLNGEDTKILQADNKKKVLVFARRDAAAGGGGGVTVVAMNFSGEALKGYPMRLPRGAAGNVPIWHCHFNSGLKAYDESFGGQGAVPGEAFQLASKQRALAVDLAPWSMQIYSPKGPATAKVKMAAWAEPGEGSEYDVQGLLDDWEEGPEAVRAATEEYIEEIVAPYPYRMMPLP